jgi:hypothetical protein
MWSPSRVGVAVCVLAVIGCGSVTRAKYEKISKGMTRAEVEGVLGKGKEVPAAEMDFTPFMVVRLGPPKPGEDPADMPSQPGLPPMKDLKEKTTWVRWGDDKKFIVVGFIDDKAVAQTARIPN